MVADDESGESIESDIRTSSGMFLYKAQDEVVAGLESRIAAWTFLPVENGEALQILYYERGQKYEPHFDFFHDKANQELGGHRVATVLMYLSNVEKGGETVFPNSEAKDSHPKDDNLSDCAKTGYSVFCQGNLNLITQALAAVGCKMEVIPDPSTVHFHLPSDLSVRVHREYSEFITELTSKFPHEKEGILKFYGECWKIFNALNSLELKSLEEPIYLFGQFFKKPTECLTLAYYLPQNAGDIARKFIKDQQVLSFIDAECFIVSTVNALQTPMINASMVLCDRHYGGINYPVGGVGGIAKSLAKGLVDQGSEILYKANVKKIIVDNGKAVGVRLSNGREFFAKNIISNATRWDTFGKLLKQEELPTEEERFQKLYVKAPSFLSIHLGVKADVLPPDTDCHHFILENDWSNLEEPYGSIFLSIPTVLDPSLAPEGNHILHIFTTSSIEDWQGISQKDYESKKELVADQIISRLEKKLFPGLRSSVVFKEVGTPKTHRRYLARDSGTYGPMPRGTPKGLLGMPFNTTAIDSLYCVGDSCYPGQGVIAVAFSGVMCAHRVAADLGLEQKSPILDAVLLRLLGWFRSLA